MKRLKELRIKNKKSQEQIGKLLNISQAAYSKYENGLAEPDNKSLLILADFYDVSVDYLLGREEKEKSADKMPADKEKFFEKTSNHDFIKEWDTLTEDDKELLFQLIKRFVNKNK